MKIIHISGKARHGKDTLAMMLRNHLEARGKKVLIVHYADQLKYMARNFAGWNGEKDEAGRRLLQELGTNVIRKQYPNYWVNMLYSQLNALADYCEWDFVLIPDTRFPNELNLGDYDHLHIRIERPDFDNGLSAEAKNHASETALDDVLPDILVENGGTLRDLYSLAERLVARLTPPVGESLAGGAAFFINTKLWEE